MLYYLRKLIRADGIGNRLQSATFPPEITGGISRGCLWDTEVTMISNRFSTKDSNEWKVRCCKLPSAFPTFRRICVVRNTSARKLRSNVVRLSTARRAVFSLSTLRSCIRARDIPVSCVSVFVVTHLDFRIWNTRVIWMSSLRSPSR